MKQLIEDLISAMEYHVEQTRPVHMTTVAIQAAKDALKAMPAQEPVALVIDGVLVKSELPEKYTGHLYTTPPKRKWVGLTDEEMLHIGVATGLERAAVEMISNKLKDKNA